MRALALLAPLALASCLTQRADVAPAVHEEKIEVVREKDDAGHVVRERLVIVKRGEKPLAHGPDKGWYSNGTRRHERDFDHGAPRGVWRTWHANGQLASETTFGGVETVTRFWHENGLLGAEGPAQNGSRQGPWRFYRPDGSLREEGTFVDSVREGEWFEYDAEGSKRRVVYLKGRVLSRQ